MEGMEKIEVKFKNFFNFLFNISRIQKAEENKANYKLNTFVIDKNKMYKTLYDELIVDNEELKENSELMKHIGDNYKDNYNLLYFFSRHNEAIDNKEVYKYLFENSEESISKKISNLLALSKEVFVHPEIIKLINDEAIGNIYGIIKSRNLMQDKNFVDCFIKFIETNNLNDLYCNTNLMEIALNEHIDFNLILLIGQVNSEKLSSYLKENSSKELFDKIASIKNSRLKKYLVSKIYTEVSEDLISALIKFFNIKDVRDQLLDKNSFYYKILIKDKESNIKEYASKDRLFSYDVHYTDDIFQNMIHYFDSLVNHYIYFNEDNKIVHTPVLYYIESMKTKLNNYFDLISKLNSGELSDKEQQRIKLQYSHILNNNNFKQFCFESLSENAGTSINEDLEAYWDYIMNNIPDNIDDYSYTYKKR